MINMKGISNRWNFEFTHISHGEIVYLIRKAGYDADELVFTDGGAVASKSDTGAGLVVLLGEQEWRDLLVKEYGIKVMQWCYENILGERWAIVDTYYEWDPPCLEGYLNSDKEYHDCKDTGQPATCPERFGKHLGIKCYKLWRHPCTKPLIEEPAKNGL